MKYISEPFAICLTGMSGVGKSTFGKRLEEDGISYFYTKEIAPEILGYEVNNLDHGNIFGGNTVFIENILNKILENKVGFFVLDSLKSIVEWEYVNRRMNATLIGITCDELIREERIRNRNPNISPHELKIRENADRGMNDKYLFNIPLLLEKAEYVIRTDNNLDSQIDYLRGILQWK